MKKDDKNDNKTVHGNENDDPLWVEAMKDVTPLKGQKDYILPENPQKQAKPATKLQKFEYIDPKVAEKPSKNPQNKGNEVDKRNLGRFKAGKMPIEARIDLHNMNQQQAHEALTRFIISAHASGKRCVLVITGKGDREKGKTTPENPDWMTPEAGILRKRVPDWLNDPALKPLILQTTPAQPKDGGTGALYILLRRKR